LLTEALAALKALGPPPVPVSVAPGQEAVMGSGEARGVAGEAVLVQVLDLSR